MTDKMIGRPIPTVPNQLVSIQRPDGSMTMSHWLGHSREESGPPRLPHERVKILATEYTEKDIPFRVPYRKAIDAYLINSDNYPGGRGVFIITRDANKNELIKCDHPRHPRFTER